MQITRLKRVGDEWVQVVEDMTPEEILEYQKSLVPESITPRQIRLAMIQFGINLWQIDTTIQAMNEPQKSVVNVLREYSLSFEIRENSIQEDEIYYTGFLQQESISIFNKYIELIQERQNQISEFLNFVKGIAWSKIPWGY